MGRLSLLIVAALTGSLLVGCGGKGQTLSANDDNATPRTMESLQVPAGFDFATTQGVDVEVAVVDPTGAPLCGVRVDVRRPVEGGAAILSGSGATDAAGRFERRIEVPAHTQQLELEVAYVGVSGQATVPIVNGSVSYTFGTDTGRRAAGTVPANGKVTVLPGVYTYMGSWDNQGVPTYLQPQADTIDAAFLADINASLPEYRPVPQFHPAYLENGAVTDVKLREAADVWITFVHEGAGYRNALGYYTHPVGQSPTSLADISDLKVIFPNVSYVNSGGGLHSGDRVFLGHFAAGTEIDWFLVTDGYDVYRVLNRKWTLFSEPQLNPEANPTLKQHTVLLRDRGRERVVMGFEDLRRESSDNDFNDAVFYVTAVPFSAVVTDNMATVTGVIDTDHDGVGDFSEDYPLDPARAYNNYFPSTNGFATLAYEDMWPTKGDYDFNDLVVDYRINEVTNAANLTVDIKGDFKVRAAGALYDNGLAIALPLSPADINYVHGSHLTETYMNVPPNSVESGVAQAVAVVFDNAGTVVARPAGYYVNTQLGAPSVAPQTVSLDINLTTPRHLTMTPPYNPFAIINRQRGQEVHLPGRAPTSLATAGLLNTGDDASRTAGYYKGGTGLPWAVNIATSWSYPVESAPIVSAYTHFAEWAESGGVASPDWYLKTPANTHAQQVYPSP